MRHENGDNTDFSLAGLTIDELYDIARGKELPSEPFWLDVETSTYIATDNNPNLTIGGIGHRINGIDAFRASGPFWGSPSRRNYVFSFASLSR